MEIVINISSSKKEALSNIKRKIVIYTYSKFFELDAFVVPYTLEHRYNQEKISEIPDKQGQINFDKLISVLVNKNTLKIVNNQGNNVELLTLYDYFILAQKQTSEIDAINEYLTKLDSENFFN